MNKNQIKQKILELSPWYQTIDLNGIITTDYSKTYEKSLSGDLFWNKIKLMIPDNLIDNRILDLGCNAGIYCIKCSLLNCKEVIGIESNNTFYNQALFIKDFFEEKYNRKLDNIIYINQDISDIDFNKLGRFDYVFAFSILYHIGKHKFGKYSIESMNEQKRIIHTLTNISDKIFVRCRNNKLNNLDHYNKIFKEFNFKNLKYIPERKRGLILYGKI